MRCFNCGNEVGDNEYICPYCSLRLRPDEDAVPILTPEEMPETAKPKKKRIPVLIIAAAVLIAAAYMTARYAALRLDNDADRLFNNGLTPVYSDMLWGYADSSGKLVIDTKFNSAYAFSENGLAAAVMGNEMGYIDKSGKFVTEMYPYNEKIGFFSDEGLAFMKDDDGDYGYINKKGEWVIAARYDDARGFKNGCAAVKIGDGWGYINTDGIIISDFIYEEAGEFSKNGLAAVKKDGKWVYIDKGGTVTVDGGFSEAHDFKNGLAAVKTENGWNYIDENGNIKIEINADDARDFSMYAAVCINGLWGYINKNGKTVIEPRFLEAGKFSENGCAAVKTENGMGIINKKGKLVTDDDYYSISVYDDGYAVYSEDGVLYGIMRSATGAKIGDKYNFVSYDRTYYYTNFARYYCY